MKSHPVFEKLRIFAPGPTPVPQEVLSELAKPPLHHRTKEFIAILERTRKGLQFLFQTKQPAYLFSSSGTGAMEAAVVNLLVHGDEVIVVNGGKFGERWLKMGTAFGLKVHAITVPWGTAVDPGAIEQCLKANRGVRAVLFQASETSTGVAHPTQAIAQVVHQSSDALVIVDAITALGVTDLPMDTWGLDAVISGSQKALMLPPGLAFLALSERAQEQRKRAKIPNFYFNLSAEDKATLGGETAWTPAVGLVMALDIVLQRIQQIGLAPLFQYYDYLAAATRAGLSAMELELFAKSHYSPAVTAVVVPQSIPDGKKIVSLLRDRYAITIAGGQDQWKGKVFRVAHLGFYDELDMLTILSALELVLRKLGHACPPGSGVGATASYFLKHEPHAS